MPVDNPIRWHDKTLVPPEPLYYIQNKGYQGNCLVWWADGGHGYTCDLDKAWKVPHSQAVKICMDRPEQDFPRRAYIVDGLASKHVTQESERRFKEIKTA